MYTPLFDRFESDRSAGLGELARDIADFLGARSALPGHQPGVLSWGLPDMSGLASTSMQDRQRIADYIARAIEQFEPRLERVSVTPVEDATDFIFQIEAQLVELEDDESENAPITLRILSPHRGGGLGAEVVAIGT
jgi:type VI secretion system lysozyme-like protein